MTSALADVVWFIGPECDHLSDLFSRMRRIGNDLCEAHGVRFEFRHPENDLASLSDGHIRRNLFLIFKEALRNAIRHGRCHRFRVTCEEQKGSLLFQFADDGTGFETEDVGAGQGLVSMRRRAEAIKASIVIRSARGRGTTISLSLNGRIRHLPESR